MRFSFCYGFILRRHDFRKREAKLLDPRTVMPLVKMSQKPEVLRRVWGDRSQACWFVGISTSKHNPQKFFVGIVF